MFFDVRRYDLAKVGRYKFNKKLALRNRIAGFTLAEDAVSTETGEVIAEAGTVLTEEKAAEIQNAAIPFVKVQTEEGREEKVISNLMVDLNAFLPNADKKALGITEEVYYPKLKELMEEEFDRIAVGRADWVQTVDQFYKTFKPLLSSISSGKVSGRELGTDPATGQPVIAKISKIGPCVQLGDAANEKPRFASLKKGQSIFTITLAEALDLFRTSLPLSLGEWDGKEIIIGEGKYGPYILFNKAYISIPKGKDPLSVTKEEAIRLIEEKQQTSTPIQQWGDVQVLNGRYGAYIHTKEGNYQLPKKSNPETITEAEVREIMARNEPIKPGKRTFNKKSAK